MKKRSLPQYPKNQTSNNWILPCSHKFKIFNLRENCMQNSAICVQQCGHKSNPKHLKTPHRPQNEQQLLKNIFYKVVQSEKILNLTSSLFRDYENSETYFKQIGNIMEAKIKEVCNEALKSENNEVVGKLLGQLFQGRISELKCHEMNMILNCERQFSSFTSRKLVDLEVAVKSEIIKLLNLITEASQRIEGYFQNTIEMFSKIRKPQQIQQQPQQPQVSQTTKPTLISAVHQKTEQSDKDKRLSIIEDEKNKLKVAQPIKPQQKPVEIPKISKQIKQNVKQTPKEVQKKPQLKNITQKPLDNIPKAINKITPVVEKMIPEEIEQKALQTPKPQPKKMALDKGNLPTPKQKTQPPKQQQKSKQKSPQTQREPHRQIKQVTSHKTSILQKKQVPQNKTQGKQFWNLVESFKRTGSVSRIFDDRMDTQNQELKDEPKKKVKITTQDDPKPKAYSTPLMKESMQSKQEDIQNNQNQQNIRKQVKMFQPSINSLMSQKKTQLQGETYSPFGRKIINKDSNSPATNQEKKDLSKYTPTEKIEKQSSTISKKAEDNINAVGNKKGFMERLMKQEQEQEQEKEIQVPKKTQQYPSKLINKEKDSVPKSKVPLQTKGKEEIKRVQMKEPPKQAGTNKLVVLTAPAGETVRRNDQVNMKKSEKVIVGETKDESSKSCSLLGQVRVGSFQAAGNKPSQLSFLSKPTLYEDKPGKQAQKVGKVTPKEQQMGQKISTPLKNPSQKQTQSRQEGPKPSFIRKPLSIGKVGQNVKKPLPQLTNEVFERAIKAKQQQLQRQAQFNQISLHGELQQSTKKQPISESTQTKQEIKFETPQQPQQQKQPSQPLIQEKQKQQQQQQPAQQRKYNFNNNNYLQSRNAFRDLQQK